MTISLFNGTTTSTSSNQLQKSFFMTITKTFSQEWHSNGCGGAAAVIGSVSGATVVPGNRRVATTTSDRQRIIPV